MQRHHHHQQLQTPAQCDVNMPDPCIPTSLLSTVDAAEPTTPTQCLAHTHDPKLVCNALFMSGIARSGSCTVSTNSSSHQCRCPPYSFDTSKNFSPPFLQLAIRLADTQHTTPRTLSLGSTLTLTAAPPHTLTGDPAPRPVRRRRRRRPCPPRAAAAAPPTGSVSGPPRG